MSAPALTVIGSINLDIVARADALPAPGQTVMGGTLAMYPGGKGANQALAASRLGASVSMIGRVGSDAHAGQALALLRAEGVDLAGVDTDPDHPTGVALINVGPGGENQIVVAPGANGALRPGHLPAIEGAVICQLEIPVETVQAAARAAPGFFALNLAPALDVPDSLIERADLIVANETEAAFYGLDRLLKPGKRLAVTLGARGAILHEGGTETVRAAPPEVTPVDTTGAGDTFVAALTLALIEGRSDSDALAFACAAGAASTLTHGAQSSLPRREAVAALMQDASGPHGPS